METAKPNRSQLVEYRARAKRRSGNYLREFRKGIGHTQTSMAEAITARGYHIDRNGYHNWERGYLPKHEALVVLHRMGLDLNAYIKGED